MKITVDIDKTVSILRADNCPASMGAFDNSKGEPVLAVVFVLPEYIEEAKRFAESLNKKRQSAE